MGRPLVYKTGQRHGTWVILQSCHSKNKADHWLHLCRCDCGKEALRSPGALKRSPSCLSCFQKGEKAYMYRHGGAANGERDYLYRRWSRMRERCADPNRSCYGGRGISVCPEWDDYAVFKEWALDNGYKKGLTLDRIDVNGNYEPSNCRWLTMLEQQWNRRNTVYITAFGETKSRSEWLLDARCVISLSTLQSRTARMDSWDSYEELLTTPKTTLADQPLCFFGETKSLTAWVKDPRCGASKKLLLQRLAQGVTDESMLLAPSVRKSISIWNETKSYAEWGRDPRCAVSVDVFAYRVKSGWEPEKALTLRAVRGANQTTEKGAQK